MPPKGDAKRLGLVDMTVMRELLIDYPATLGKVAGLGYSTFGFRLFGYAGPSPDEPPPHAKAAMVREAGLEVGAIRLSPRNADYNRELDIAAEIGARLVVISTGAPFITGPKMFETTRDLFEAWLPQLAMVGEQARKRGLRLAYHNHPYDFAPLDGKRPFDLIARNISPELVSFEIDLAWLWLAGIDILPFLRSLGRRVVTMHWKDIDRSRGTNRSDQAVALGQGEMGYSKLLPAILRVTDATAYIEVDRPADGIAAATAGVAMVRRVLS